MITTNQITVIIPAFNSEKYIRDSINSVRKQMDGKAYIVVVDDGSTDNTALIAKELGCYVISSEHKGTSAARNLALEKVSTSFVFFLDSDDILMENAFNCLITEFEKNHELDAVFGLTTDFISPELSNEQKTKLQPRLVPYGGILPGCGLLRKQVCDKVGFFNEELSPGEVIDWIIRLRDTTSHIKQINQVTLKRRIHLNNSGRICKLQESKNYATILRSRMRIMIKNT